MKSIITLTAASFLFSVACFDAKVGKVGSVDTMVVSDSGDGADNLGPDTREDSAETVEIDTPLPECETDEDCVHPGTGPYCIGDDLLAFNMVCRLGRCEKDEYLVAACEFGCGASGGANRCLECSTDVDCDDSNLCTEDSCEEGFCFFTPRTTAPLCDGSDCVYGTRMSDFDCDNSFCTMGDYCDAGVCKSGSFGCLTEDPCIKAECRHSEKYDAEMCFFALTDPNATCLQTRKGQEEGGCIVSSCQACETDEDCGIGDNSKCEGGYFNSYNQECIDGLCREVQTDSDFCEKGCVHGGCKCDLNMDCYWPLQKACGLQGVCVEGTFSSEDGNFCNTDADCTTSVWGQQCVPSTQPSDLGYDYLGLCQECDQEGNNLCPAEAPTCKWGLTWKPKDGSPSRSFYYCE